MSVPSLVGFKKRQARVIWELPNDQITGACDVNCQVEVTRSQGLRDKSPETMSKLQGGDLSALGRDSSKSAGSPDSRSNDLSLSVLQLPSYVSSLSRRD